MSLGDRRAPLLLYSLAHFFFFGGTPLFFFPFLPYSTFACAALRSPQKREAFGGPYVGLENGKEMVFEK